MQTRSFVVACLVLAVTACDERRSPVAPLPQSTTPSTPTAPTPTAPTVPQLMGLVRDSRGNPIAGATIEFWPALDKRFSNEAGEFPIPVGSYYEIVYASKPGYENAIADGFLDRIALTLHDIIRIPAGQSARVTVRPDDSLGGYGLMYRVRTIRVFSNGDRIARMQLLADDNGPVDYRVPELCGDVCPPNSPTTFFIEGGGERRVQIHVPAISILSRTFTLITTAEEP